MRPRCVRGYSPLPVLGIEPRAEFGYGGPDFLHRIGAPDALAHGLCRKARGYGILSHPAGTRRQSHDSGQVHHDASHVQG